MTSKGQKYKKWTAEEKFNIIKPILDMQKSTHDITINNYNTVQEFIDNVVCDNNNYRPSYALEYKKPVEYRTQLGFK